jgi:manganese transport protein
VRRLITRSLAIIPAAAVIWVMGEAGTYKLLILSQVILSLQLPFAIAPLIKFTSDRKKMGPFASPLWLKTLAWVIAAIIIGLNAQLVIDQLAEWMEKAGNYRWLIQFTVMPIAAGLGLLLLWIIARGIFDWHKVRPAVATSEAVLQEVFKSRPTYQRIGIALDASPRDAAMLREAIGLASVHNAELVLMHVVEGVGGQWYGEQTADRESRHDEVYMEHLATQLKENAHEHGCSLQVKVAMGYGSPPKEVIRMAREEAIDLLIVGGHGHRFLSDLLRGQTIQHIRHMLRIPVLAVRGTDAPSPALPRGAEEWERPSEP